MSRLKWQHLDIDPRKIEESVTVKPNIRPESKLTLEESSGGLRYLMPRIEAIHAGRTRNFVRYQSEKLKGSAELKSGVYSWIHPFAKPVIYNHDVNTRATGRIHNAYFSEMTAAGRPGITVVPKITDKQAVDDIMAGLLMTVSIGATTDSAVCNICGTDVIEEGFCGHYKGEVYDGVEAEWIAGNIWFDELSWVNVPADQDAMITDIGQIAMAESFGGFGKDIIDLGKKSTEWTLSQTSALAEGLTILKTKEGESALTIEELQAQVTELQEKNNELTTQVEEASQMIQAKEAELLEKATQLDEKTAELAEKTTELEAKTTELTEKTTELEALKTTKEEVEAQKTDLAEELEAVKADKESLVEKNTELVAKAHQSLVERVVDLRISLGKETNRQEVSESYSKRTTESLSDSLEDLLKEFSNKPVERTLQSVDNPTVNSLKDNVEPNLLEGKKAEQLTAEDALKGLFSGPAFKK